MTLQQLTYLVKVAECGNITEAAIWKKRWGLLPLTGQKKV